MPVSVFADRATLMRAAAEHIVRRAGEAITARGRFSWVLSGGSTPAELYALLGAAPYASQLDWSRVHLFWGDERCVPPDHPDSNYRMVRETLLSAIALPPGNVHRMRAEREPAAAAASYEAELRKFFGLSHDAEPPSFDVVLLGMGADGHTASLFPGTAALIERQRWVVAQRVSAVASWRLTLTLPLLNAAAHVMFLVAGRDKAQRLQQILSSATSAPLPAALVRPTGEEAEWLVDRDAAGLLDSPS